MSMQSRNQYLDALIRKHHGYHTQSRKEKTKLLDEYCATTKQDRKYVIRKLRSGNWVHQLRKESSDRLRVRRETYDRSFRPFLIQCWKIFDRPCGQRLKTSLHDEVDRLIRLGELTCSATIAKKLKAVSARTIDTKLKPHKEKEHLLARRGKMNNPLLFQKIPVKRSDDMSRLMLGNIQTDLVEHCGQSAYGDFVYSLSNTDIATGWWEGEGQFSRSMVVTARSIDSARRRFPLAWKEIHSDNDSTFINAQLFAYTQKEKIHFSRSRPYHKNDNCFVEQKNNTHVRKAFGHRRYDTPEELAIINDLYHGAWRLYKNFFQPVIKLAQKKRIKGHVVRRYDKPLTPYQRVMRSAVISTEIKQALQTQYASLNPAQLRREIDAAFKRLKKIYDAKQHQAKTLAIPQNLTHNSVTFLNCTTKANSVT